MANGKRSRRWWLVVPLAVAAAGIYIGISQLAFRSKTAEFTASSPQVEALREAVADANVVILVLDATRADHVGCYGYPRETTPNIDRLAKSAVVFEDHFSQSAETKSSTACLLTSQYCDTNVADGPRNLILGTFTMEGGLGKAGFQTLLISSNLKATPLYGIGADFQDSIWDRQLETLVKEGEKPFLPEVVLRGFRGWLDENHEGRFFAYIHLIPPHYPYEQPEEFTRVFEGREPVSFEAGGVPYPERIPKPIPPAPELPGWINLYDANLRYGDWAVGQVEAELRERGLLDETLLLVTSDHGEGFGEHGHVWHGRSVYDEACHIPLVVRFPKEALAGTRVDALSESIDLLPTIFDLLKVTYPAEGIQGHSLLPVLAGESDSARDYAFCRGGGSPCKYLVRNKDYALMLYSNGEWRALYDLKADPGEKHNVVEDHPGQAAAMAGVFREFADEQRRPPLDFLDPNAVMPPLPEVPEIEMTPEDRARISRIADLGYIR